MSELAWTFYTAGWVGSVLFSILAPIWIMRSHVKRQNRLIECCRAYYVLAVEALGNGNDGEARDWLRRIRCIEGRWRYGKSFPYKVALALYAIWIGFLGSTVMRVATVAPIELPRMGSQQWSQDQIEEGLMTLLTLGLIGGLWPIHAVMSQWNSPWIVDNCGERLAQILRGGKSVAVGGAARPRLSDDLTPRELFGLGPSFTVQELSAARRRLAAQFHPDRWHAAPAAQRKAAEAAMKRVNVAFDELRSDAD